jgi:hypothetical protein
VFCRSRELSCRAAERFSLGPSLSFDFVHRSGEGTTAIVYGANAGISF